MPIAIVVLLGMLGVGISLLATSLWWLGLLLVGCAVWNAYVQVVCRRQVDIETAMSVDDAAAVIERLFGGRTWDLRRSDYDFRASNRLKLHSPTIAVHLEAHSGSTKVNV